MKELALQMKETFDVLSPFIEKHTMIVCPECRKVCCADKHGRYDSDDIAYLEALDIDIPEQSAEREETASCRYMTERGCSLSRWMRPYRCTLFFCDALLKSLERDNPALFSAFNDYFQLMISLRHQFAGNDED